MPTADQWNRSPGRRLLNRLAPGAAEVFDRLVATSPTAPDMTAAVRRTCATTLGLQPLPVPPADTRPVEPAVAGLARQFSTDVSGVSHAQRANFTQTCGAETFAAIAALYVADMAPRVMALLDTLAGAGSDWDTTPAVEVTAAAFWTSVEEFLRVVHRMERVDPLMTEMVRLHDLPRQHNCRLCRSIRSRAALLAGGNETLFDSTEEADRGALDGPTRAALDLTDAMIWHPDRVSNTLVDEVRQNLSPGQAVEVVLDVMRNAANKIAVALAADAPNVTDGVEIYEIDRDGVAHYGLALP